MARYPTFLLAALVLIVVFASAAPLTPALAAREQKVFGWLLSHQNVLVLQSDDGDYTVTGKDLTGLEGKMVEITGTVTRSDKGDTIHVESAREVDE
ncbi:MAG: hypothetical protein P4L43_04305 [Syntrophobacteraceae bacterium]|nr:hypothetical protein [Syntrophobacteraceae bacterium]